MQYKDYVTVMKQAVTAKRDARIAVYEDKPLQYVESIPSSFTNLFESLVDIFAENYARLVPEQLKSTDVRLHIADMQPAVTSIVTEEGVHFCCTLQYCVVKDGEKVSILTPRETVVINFSNGEMMNEQRFSRLVFDEPMGNDEVLYAKLPEKILHAAWEQSAGAETEKSLIANYCSPKLVKTCVSQQLSQDKSSIKALLFAGLFQQDSLGFFDRAKALTVKSVTLEDENLLGHNQCNFK